MAQPAPSLGPPGAAAALDALPDELTARIFALAGPKAMARAAVASKGLRSGVARVRRSPAFAAQLLAASLGPNGALVAMYIVAGRYHLLDSDAEFEQLALALEAMRAVLLRPPGAPPRDPGIGVHQPKWYDGAAARGHTGVLALALGRGVPPGSMLGAVRLAVEHGQPAALRLLLEHGAPTQLDEHVEGNAFQLALRVRPPPAGIIRVLLQHGEGADSVRDPGPVFEAVCGDAAGDAAAGEAVAALGHVWASLPLIRREVWLHAALSCKPIRGNAAQRRVVLDWALRQPDGPTCCLLWAAGAGDDTVAVEMLAAPGVDTHRLAGAALLRAAGAGAAATVAALLPYLLSPLSQPQLQAALMAAVQSTKPANVISQLLRSGANARASDCEALSAAASRSSTGDALATLLAEAGPFSQSQLDTALVKAAGSYVLCGSSNIANRISQLLRSGANAQASNCEALFAAASCSGTGDALAALLAEAGPFSQSQLDAALVKVAGSHMLLDGIKLANRIRQLLRSGAGAVGAALLAAADSSCSHRNTGSLAALLAAHTGFSLAQLEAAVKATVGYLHSSSRSVAAQAVVLLLESAAAAAAGAAGAARLQAAALSAAFDTGHPIAVRELLGAVPLPMWQVGAAVDAVLAAVGVRGRYYNISARTRQYAAAERVVADGADSFWAEGGEHFELRLLRLAACGDARKVSAVIAAPGAAGRVGPRVRDAAEALERWCSGGD